MHAEGERVILTGADGRQEIALTGLQPAERDTTSSLMPEPLCPAGAVTSEPVDAAELAPPAPGTSPLDEARPAAEAEEGGPR